MRLVDRHQRNLGGLEELERPFGQQPFRRQVQQPQAGRLGSRRPRAAVRRRTRCCWNTPPARRSCAASRPGPSSAKSAATRRRPVRASTWPALESTAICRRPWAARRPNPARAARSSSPRPAAAGNGRSPSIDGARGQGSRISSPGWEASLSMTITRVGLDPKHAIRFRRRRSPAFPKKPGFCDPRTDDYAKRLEIVHPSPQAFRRGKRDATANDVCPWSEVPDGRKPRSPAFSKSRASTLSQILASFIGPPVFQVIRQSLYWQSTTKLLCPVAPRKQNIFERLTRAVTV